MLTYQSEYRSLQGWLTLKGHFCYRKSLNMGPFFFSWWRLKKAWYLWQMCLMFASPKMGTLSCENNSDRWVWVLRPKLLTPIQTKSDQFFFKKCVNFGLYVIWHFYNMGKKIQKIGYDCYFSLFFISYQFLGTL